MHARKPNLHYLSSLEHQEFPHSPFASCIFMPVAGVSMWINSERIKCFNYSQAAEISNMNNESIFRFIVYFFFLVCDFALPKVGRFGPTTPFLPSGVRHVWKRMNMGKMWSVEFNPRSQTPSPPSNVRENRLLAFRLTSALRLCLFSIQCAHFHPIYRLFPKICVAYTKFFFYSYLVYIE